MMIRLLLSLVLVCATASAAVAKDLCIQVDTGTYAGSQVVLKGAKLGPQKFGPVNGYFYEYGPPIDNAYPVHGQTVVSSGGLLALGLLRHPTSVNTAGGSGQSSGPAQQITLTCLPGADGKIGVLDGCNGYVLGDIGPNMHVIDCKDSFPIP